MNLTEAQARARFADSPVAVLGTADGAGVPHLVPVVFVLSKGKGETGTAGPGTADLLHIAIDGKPKRSQNLRRLRNIAANPRVSLLVQHYEGDWTRLWWARADGAARVLDAGDVPGDVLFALASRYPWYRGNPPGGPVIEVLVTAWSGWAFAGSVGLGLGLGLDRS
ncbi:MAG: TIGR03668 family PPOX class F420-dependent oxidoreductase [Actinocrinis sp.]